MSAVIVDVGSGVAKLTLNRPDRHNAWTIEMEDDFFRALEMCSQSRDVRAIVVTGTDPGF
jgi:enoyl-CoA hydratase/carnithine racemase